MFSFVSLALIMFATAATHCTIKNVFMFVFQKVRRISFYLSLLYAFIFPSLASCQTATTNIEEETAHVGGSIRATLYKNKPHNQLINYGENHIMMSDSNSLSYFFDRLKVLEQSKKGVVKVLHIGDSHIQADFMTSRMRAHFQNQFGNAGMGLVFPYKVAKTNNPLCYRVHYKGYWEMKKIISGNHYSKWGLDGFTLRTTSRSASITFTPRKYKNHPFSKIDKIRVYYPSTDKKSFEPVVYVPTNEIKTKRIDSNGFLEVVFSKSQHSVSIGLKKATNAQNHFLLQGVSLLSNEDGVVYHAVGVNSATTAHFLRCSALEKQVASIAPDLIIIGLGTNDAYPSKFDDALYLRQLETLIRRLRTHNPDVSILLTTPNDTYRYKKTPNYNTQKVEKRLMELMSTQKVALWNFYRIMGGLKSIKAWQKAGLAHYDFIHLSEEGYYLQGDLFYEALMEAYQK